ALPLSLPPALHHRALPSFPTRRSSDLVHRARDSDPPRNGHLISRCWRSCRNSEGAAGEITTVVLECETKGAPDLPRTAEQPARRSEEHTSELQSPCNLVCRLLLEKKKN